MLATGDMPHEGKTIRVAISSDAIEPDTSIASLGPSEHGHYCYKLDLAELPAFCAFRDYLEDNLESTRQVHRLGIALEYFDFSFNVKRPEHQVVDLFISLEALLKNGLKDSSTLVGTRLSNLIGKDDAEGRAIFGQYKVFFHNRCDIVHGTGMVRNQDLNVPGLRELVRKTILAVMVLGLNVGFDTEFFRAVDALAQNNQLKRTVQEQAFSHEERIN